MMQNVHRFSATLSKFVLNSSPGFPGSLSLSSLFLIAASTGTSTTGLDSPTLDDVFFVLGIKTRRAADNEWMRLLPRSVCHRHRRSPLRCHRLRHHRRCRCVWPLNMNETERFGRNFFLPFLRQDGLVLAHGPVEAEEAPAQPGRVVTDTFNVEEKRPCTQRTAENTQRGQLNFVRA